MPQIALPTEGQPLDVSLMGQIISSINDLQKQGDKPSTYVQIKTENTAGSTDQKITETKFCAFRVSLNQSGSVSAGKELQWSVDYSGNYSEKPIVVATPEFIAGSNVANKQVNVYVSESNASNAKGYIYYPAASSDVGVIINVITMGKPA